MENNNGADKLISSIIEEAQAQAAAIESQAADEAAAIRRRLENDRERLKDEFAAKAAAERDEAVRRAVTNAELDGRKELLAKKRELIDRAYDEAYSRLCALTGPEREKILKKLLVSECSGGETVLPAKADQSALSKLIRSCGVSGLTVGEPESSIDGGFILRGANFVKDCSFRALMEDVRAKTLESVAEILF